MAGAAGAGESACASAAALAAAGRGAARGADGKLVVLDEPLYYSSLFEEYVAPRRHRRAPDDQRVALHRAHRRLRIAARWRIMSERKYFKPVAIPGEALRLTLPEGQPLQWCCCPFVPCPCMTGARRLPWHRIPKGRRRCAEDEGDEAPLDAVQRLRRAAREGCLCPLRMPGLPMCPAAQLDFVCNTGAVDYTVRRKIALLSQAMARIRGTWKEEYPREELSRYKQSSVGTQTWENIDGTMFIGEGKLLYGRSTMYGRREQYRAKRRLEARRVALERLRREQREAACLAEEPEPREAAGEADGDEVDDPDSFTPSSLAEQLFNTLDGKRVHLSRVKPPILQPCKHKKSWLRCYCKK